MTDEKTIGFTSGGTYRTVELTKKCVHGRPGDKVTFSEKVAIRLVRDGFGNDCGEYQIPTPIKKVNADGSVEFAPPGDPDLDDETDEDPEGEARNKANPKTTNTK